MDEKQFLTELREVLDEEPPQGSCERVLSHYAGLTDKAIKRIDARLDHLAGSTN